MNLHVYSRPSLKSRAAALVDRLGVAAQSQVDTFPVALRSLAPRAHCVLFLSGGEPAELIHDALRTLARGKRWSGKVVLYSEQPDLERVVEWARLIERLLPRRSYLCFVEDKVADVLRLDPPASVSKVESSGTVPPMDVPSLRQELGLTQEQLASAVGVSPRTIQNWELGKPSPRAARRLRDLLELCQVLRDYLPSDRVPEWMTTPNDAFNGSTPLELVVDGRARDVLLEYRRLQVGEPL